MSHSKILVIGLDGAPMNLVQMWVAAGHLPTLASFFDQGAWGEWESVPNLNSAPAWSSMVTGVNPGRHGIYYFTEYNPQNRSQAYTNASYRDADAVWQIASAAGKRVNIINVPLSYPADQVNGFMLAGIDTPGVNAPGFSWPPDLYAELRERVGEYTIASSLGSLFKMGRLEQALATAHETIDQRCAATAYLLQSAPWDLTMVVFYAPDQVQHYYWRFMEPERYGLADAGEVLRNGILDTYRHMDRVIHDLIQTAGEDVTVVIVSDHGFMADDGRDRFLPAWLEKMGLLKRKGSGRLDQVLSRAYNWMDRNIPKAVKDATAGALPSVRKDVEKRMAFADIDWTATKAFTMFSRAEIWINLRGRNRDGLVNPGQEYNAVCQQITQELLSARDRDTGQPLVKRVLRKEQVYHGLYADKAPDLTIQWNDVLIRNVVLGDGSLAANLLNEAVLWDPFHGLRSGEHDTNGIILMKGPTIKRGPLPLSQIVDFLPTMLHLLNVPIPGHLDGKIIADAFQGDVEPFGAANDRLAHGRSQEPFNPEEEAVIESRLRDLGYID